MLSHVLVYVLCHVRKASRGEEALNYEHLRSRLRTYKKSKLSMSQYAVCVLKVCAVQEERATHDMNMSEHTLFS